MFCCPPWNSRSIRCRAPTLRHWSCFRGHYGWVVVHPITAGAVPAYPNCRGDEVAMRTRVPTCATTTRWSAQHVKPTRCGSCLPPEIVIADAADSKSFAGPGGPCARWRRYRHALPAFWTFEQASAHLNCQTPQSLHLQVATATSDDGSYEGVVGEHMQLISITLQPA